MLLSDIRSPPVGVKLRPLLPGLGMVWELESGWRRAAIAEELPVPFVVAVVAEFIIRLQYIRWGPPAPVQGDYRSRTRSSLELCAFMKRGYTSQYIF